MIRELMSVFRKDSLMDQAYNRSFEMLHLTQDMFNHAKGILRESESHELDYNINDQDHEVNKYQRDVRKDVVSHLTLTGTEELASSLVLVSIVIDIERIGDYTKNIAEIAENYHGGKLKAGKYEEEVQKIEEAVVENFKLTIDCFKESDEEKAQVLLKNYKWVSKSSDGILKELMRDKNIDLDSASAVALAVYVRSLKRIYSHLRNVTTSVVNPFHRIGYKPKKNK